MVEALSSREEHFLENPRALVPKSLTLPYVQYHHVLGNFDIAEIIARPLPIGSLLSLAFVSQQMALIALTVLWRTIHSSAVLLKLLPGFENISGEWRFRGRPFEIYELGSWKFYAPKIHHIISLFSTTVGGPCNIDPAVFEKIASALAPKVPLPSLKTMILPPFMQVTPSSIASFVTSTLTCLELTVRDGCDYFERLVTYDPRILLQNISVSGLIRQCDIQSILHFSTMKRLAVIFANEETGMGDVFNLLLHNLHHFRDLQSLKVAIPAKVLPITPHVPPPITLTMISVIGEETAVATFLSAFSGLKDVVIEAHGDWSPNGWGKCFYGLRMTSGQTLQSIRLISPASLSLSLAHLLEVHTITAFEIMRTMAALDLTDSDIDRIARAWPKLRILYFASDFPTIFPSQLTTSVIPILAKLEDLTLLRIGLGSQSVSLPLDDQENVNTFSREEKITRAMMLKYFKPWQLNRV